MKKEFRGDEVTPELLRSLAPDIDSLVIWGGKPDLAALADLKQLTCLVLGEMGIGDEIFDILRELPRLDTLNLAYTAVRGDFSRLAGLPLRELRLEGCRFVNDASARTLAAFPTLRHLELHMTGITDEGVAALAGLPLEVLWLGPRISDAGVESISRIRTLRHLDLCAHMVTDEGIPLLANLTQLEVLWLPRCSITDASVPSLSSMTWLRELNIGDTGITPQGQDKLRAALPACVMVKPD
jgi:hypothetical protein